jgi:hypothetical protein
MDFNFKPFFELTKESFQSMGGLFEYITNAEKYPRMAVVI